MSSTQGGAHGSWSGSAREAISRPFLGEATEMALSYELLLDLYRGRATVVEHITDPAQRHALAVDTPVAQMLGEFDRRESPRHVVLTGSAGDGKTFAALTAQTHTFTVIADASARRPGINVPPVDDLAAQIEEVLRDRRLLLAINRGQLERLYERTSSRGGPVGAFVSEVRARTHPKDVWPALSPDVAVADLGWLERGSAALAMAEKVAGMATPPHLSAPTREAFGLARASLGTAGVREWVASIVNAATAAGANVTMRQLWSFIAYLATGARAPDDTTPVTPADAVGARMFDTNAEGALFAVALDRCDPSLTPSADLARGFLTGKLLEKAKGSSIGPLFAGGCTDGRTFQRIAAVHGISGGGPPRPKDHFAETVTMLTSLPDGPQPSAAITRSLLRGIYKSLGLWHSADTLPAWQTLCFDSSRVDTAAAVADSALSPQAFKLALPRPPPDVAPHLKDGWRPPFLWLCGPSQARLRLSPRSFRALLGASGASPLNIDAPDLFAFDSWLRRVGSSTRGLAVPDSERLRVGRRYGGHCVVIESGLNGKKSVTVE